MNVSKKLINYTVLLFLSVTVLLTGCKGNRGADVSGMVEGEKEAAVGDSRNATEREAAEGDSRGAAEEAAAEGDSGDAAEEDSAAKAGLDKEPDRDKTEIYERFLNGELTITWKKEQVSVAELFWDNDIQYCYWDIDGDGEKELHIRDSVAYYAVKVNGNEPQILFEGWWGYEPVVSDGQCGILHYYMGYCHESIEFMTVNTEGSAERDGEYYWSDDNGDGIMDENDRFRGLISGEEIGMGQYVRYRDAQLAKRAANELEWTNRQLTYFDTWQGAYADYILRRDAVLAPGDCSYSLIYVDEDEIPELYIDTGGMATGEFVVSYYNGHVGVMNRERVGLRYMEYGGLLYSESGNMGFYPCNIYRLEKGQFSEIGTGWSSENYDGETVNYDYFWEEHPITEAEYEAQIAKLIDKSQCVEPAVLYEKEEMLQLLESYGEKD